jgi:hypothetical protein
VIVEGEVDLVVEEIVVGGEVEVVVEEADEDEAHDDGEAYLMNSWSIIARRSVTGRKSHLLQASWRRTELSQRTAYHCGDCAPMKLLPRKRRTVTL